MDIQARIDALVAVAKSAGLVVQKVPLTGDGGGFCVVKGERRLFVDTLADLRTQYEKTLEAVAELPESAAASLNTDLKAELERVRRRRNEGTNE